MAMNEVNGIQGRLRSSAVRWGTVHNPTNQRKCDFYGGKARAPQDLVRRIPLLGMSSLCGKRPAPDLLTGAA